MGESESFSLNYLQISFFYYIFVVRKLIKNNNSLWTQLEQQKRY